MMILESGKFYCVFICRAQKLCHYMLFNKCRSSIQKGIIRKKWRWFFNSDFSVIFSGFLWNYERLADSWKIKLCILDCCLIHHQFLYLPIIRTVMKKQSSLIYAYFNLLLLQPNTTILLYTTWFLSKAIFLVANLNISSPRGCLSNAHFWLGSHQG